MLQKLFANIFKDLKESPLAAVCHNNGYGLICPNVYRSVTSNLILSSLPEKCEMNNYRILSVGEQETS